MKFSPYLVEFVVAVALVALLVLLIDPFGFMAPSFLMMLEVALILLFAIFAGFVWNEQARDEREELHRMLADRVAFLAGSGALLLFVLYQSFYHVLDPWLVVALVAMLLVKLGVAAYNRMSR